MNRYVLYCNTHIHRNSQKIFTMPWLETRNYSGFNYITRELSEEKTKTRNFKKRFNIVKMMHICSMHTCYSNKIWTYSRVLYDKINNREGYASS